MPDQPDAYFAVPRLAATYDVFEGERDDLDIYEAMVAEFGASVVLDVGCGTGVFACRLAAAGLQVIGVDPAAASLALARAKPHADLVRWVEGTAAAIPESVDADLATMTANVAQVFTTDEEWDATLRAVRAALRPGGVLTFETRDPDRRAWERWNRERTTATGSLPNGDVATTWIDVTSVDLPLVSFRSTTQFESDGVELVSNSTLRFRTQAELDRSLDSAGFGVVDVRDAPDRTGAEWVYVARRR